MMPLPAPAAAGMRARKLSGLLGLAAASFFFTAILQQRQRRQRAALSPRACVLEGGCLHTHARPPDRDDPKPT